MFALLAGLLFILPNSFPTINGDVNPKARTTKESPSCDDELIAATIKRVGISEMM